MSRLFTKKFQSPLAYLAAFLVIIFFSMLVGAYSYVQAKQIQINADLLIAGEVRTNNLCIGATCKIAWPQELLLTDIVAGGAVKNLSVSTGCNQPSSGGSRCDAFFQHFFQSYARSSWYDPRGVLTDSYTQAVMPCYEIPNGSFNPCGPARTYPVFSSFSCSGGFVADSVNPIASSISSDCLRACVNCACNAAICRLP